MWKSWEEKKPSKPGKIILSYTGLTEDKTMQIMYVMIDVVDAHAGLNLNEGADFLYILPPRELLINNETSEVKEFITPKEGKLIVSKINAIPDFWTELPKLPKRRLKKVRLSGKSIYEVVNYDNNS